MKQLFLSFGQLFMGVISSLVLFAFSANAAPAAVMGGPCDDPNTVRVNKSGDMLACSHYGEGYAWRAPGNAASASNIVITKNGTTWDGSESCASLRSYNAHEDRFEGASVGQVCVRINPINHRFESKVVTFWPQTPEGYDSPNQWQDGFVNGKFAFFTDACPIKVRLIGPQVVEYTAYDYRSTQKCNAYKKTLVPIIPVNRDIEGKK